MAVGVDGSAKAGCPGAIRERLPDANASRPEVRDGSSSDAPARRRGLLPLYRFSNSRHRSRFAARQAAVLIFTQSRDGPEW